MSDEFLKMAEECGFCGYGEDTGEYRIPVAAFKGRIDRLCKMVQDMQREKDAKICDEFAASAQQQIDSGILTENGVAFNNTIYCVSQNCASAIRNSNGE